MATNEDQPPKQPSKWRRLPKMSFTSKDLSRRMRRMEGASLKHARRFVFRRLDNFREVRKHIAIWILAVGVIVGASGLQLMWYQQSYRTIASAADGTYAEAVLGPIDTLNPIFAATSAEDSAGQLIFSRLLAYDKTGSLNYDLAKSMTISDDQRTYSVQIRDDAKWSDGVAVRARDVAFTVALLKNPATRSTIGGWNDVTATVVDDQTVTFQLPSVYASFPHALAGLPILPEHLLRDIEPSNLRENAFSASPVGSGPFVYRFSQEVEQGENRQIVHLARNENYYKGAPKLERFQLHAYADRAAISRAVTTSEVNAATDLSVTDIRNFDTERFTAEQKAINSGVYALFNTTSPVLQDKKVRQALQIGTDVAAVKKAVGGKLPDLTLPFVTGQLDGNIPSTPALDIAAANRLLDETGWVKQGDVRSKDGVPLKLTVVTTKNNDFEAALNELARQWRALGITITTTIVDPTDPSQNVAQNIFQQRNFDVLLYQLNIGGDPDVYAYWHSSQVSRGLNFSNYSNPIADEALVSARTRLEPDLRNAKYQTFTRQWIADAPAIGLYQATSQYVYSKSVRALPSDEVLVAPTDRYAEVRYWTVGQRLVHQTP